MQSCFSLTSGLVTNRGACSSAILIFYHPPLHRGRWLTT